jgi:tetratricopeptide (TPR) repeat protein
MQSWLPRWLVITAVFACFMPASAWGQDTQTLDTTYQSLDSVPGSETRLLRAGNRQIYNVPAPAYERFKALFLTIRRDDGIRIEVGSGKTLVSIRKIRRSDSTSPSDPSGVDSNEDAKVQLQKLGRGDVVRINGAEYRLLAAGDADVTLAPRIPGSNPPEYGGRTRITYPRIVRLEIVQARERSPAEETGGVNDMLSREGLAEGDTVILRMLPGSGPSAVRGRVVGLSRTTVRMQAWRGAGYDRLIDVRREDVRQLDRIPMEARRPLAAGDVTVRAHERRFVERRASKAEFQVTLQHDEPGLVLVGLWLRPKNAQGVVLDSGGSAVRPLFPGMPRTVYLGEGELPHALTLDAEGLSSLASSGPEAEALLVEAIEEAGSAPAALGPLLLAASQSGNPRLLAYTVARAALAAGPKDVAAEVAWDALIPASEPAAVWILEMLAREDDAFQITVIRDLELTQSLLPPSVRPLGFRARLIRLFSRLSGVLDHKRASVLFNAAIRDSSLVPPLAETFRAEPSLAAPLLIDVALDPDSTSDRTQLASTVLVAMGPDGVDALSAELVNRGIDARPLVKAVEAGKDRRDLVELGLRLAKLKRFDRLVEEARAHAKAGDLEVASRSLRPVLAVLPDHRGALALLEEIRLPLARQFISTRRRSEAMRLLQGAKSQEARTRLGVLYLDAAREELTGVVVRDQPHLAAQNVGLLVKGQTLPGKRVDEDWVEVAFSAERSAYVRSACVDNAGGNFTVRVVYLPVPAFQALLDRGRELAPELEPQCQDLLGRRYLQEALQSYDDGDFERALGLFAKARELVPDDERLSAERIAWFRAHWWLLAGLGGLVFIAVTVFLLTNWMRRRQKIQLTKDAPLEIRTASGRITKRPAKTTGRGAEAPAERWTSPSFLLKLALAIALGGVILHQAWLLSRVF